MANAGNRGGGEGRRYWRKAIGAGLVAASLLVWFGLASGPVAAIVGALLAVAVGLMLTGRAAGRPAPVVVPESAAVPPEEVIDAVFDTEASGAADTASRPAGTEGAAAEAPAGAADPRPPSAGRTEE